EPALCSYQSSRVTLNRNGKMSIFGGLSSPSSIRSSAERSIHLTASWLARSANASCNILRRRARREIRDWDRSTPSRRRRRICEAVHLRRAHDPQNVFGEWRLPDDGALAKKTRARKRSGNWPAPPPVTHGTSLS